MRVVCPYCELKGKRERSFRRVTELKVHVLDTHGEIAKQLDSVSDFFSEGNGYWLAVAPEHYRKVVKPNAHRSALAV